MNDDGEEAAMMLTSLDTSVGAGGAPVSARALTDHEIHVEIESLRHEFGMVRSAMAARIANLDARLRAAGI